MFQNCTWNVEEPLLKKFGTEIHEITQRCADTSYHTEPPAAGLRSRHSGAHMMWFRKSGGLGRMFEAPVKMPSVIEPLLQIRIVPVEPPG